MKLFGLEITRAKAQQTLQGVDGDRGWTTIFDWRPGAWQADAPRVDQQAVMANWAVFSCMTLIAGDIGKMSVRLMEESKPGIWTEVKNSPLARVLKKPNRYQTRGKFFESWAFSKLSTGNAYALKERDMRGVVTALHILDPSRVRPLVAENGDVFYQLGDDDLAGLESDVPAAPASEIIHDRMWCVFHPLVGLSPIYACGLAATQGLKIQGNSAKFFENMSRPSGVLTAPAEIKDATAKRLKEHWEANFSGDKIGRVAVLGDGLKYEAMSVKAVDSQLVEQLKITAEMVCSTFHVPAYKVGVGPAPTYQNAEVLNQIYYSDCLQVQIEGIEALLDEGLTLGPYASEFDLDALLRMDSATQVKTLNEAVGGGWMAPNEARQKRNLPPVKGGATPYLQQQNFSLSALDKRDQGDPFAKPAPAPMPPTDDNKSSVERAALAQIAWAQQQKERDEALVKNLSDQLEAIAARQESAEQAKAAADAAMAERIAAQEIALQRQAALEAMSRLLSDECPTTH